MTTPLSYNLMPVGQGERPPAYPPRYLKRDIYKDPSVFALIDNHAINEARTNYRTFRDLMWNLVAKANYNDLEKARAIFRWLTTKNLYTIFFDSQLPGTPEQLIIGFRTARRTTRRYSNVWQFMPDCTA